MSFIGSIYHDNIANIPIKLIKMKMQLHMRMLMNMITASVKAHVSKPEYRDLFTDAERNMCRERLERFGYKFKER